MTQEQREQERRIRRRQMEDVFQVIEKDKYGINFIADIEEQVKLYIPYK